MSFENNDEFVVFPTGTGRDVATSDVRYSRSHNPGYAGGSGRQHRPTEPANTTLRCNEAEILGTPGPDCEVNPDMVKVPCSKSGPPGAKVNGPGKFVEPCTQVGSGRHSQGTAMLGAEPASVIGELFGVNNGTQQPAYFPHYKPIRHYPPHLRHVATPWEIKNSNFWLPLNCACSVPQRFNSLLMPRFVQRFSGNSSVNLFAAYPFKYNFL